MNKHKQMKYLKSSTVKKKPRYIFHMLRKTKKSQCMQFLGLGMRMLSLSVLNIFLDENVFLKWRK